MKVIVNSYINNLIADEIVRFSYIYPLTYQIPGVVVADVKTGLFTETTEAKNINLNPNGSAECKTEDAVIISDQKA